jgi:hypothetical protein
VLVCVCVWGGGGQEGCLLTALCAAMALPGCCCAMPWMACTVPSTQQLYPLRLDSNSVLPYSVMSHAHTAHNPAHCAPPPAQAGPTPC